MATKKTPSSRTTGTTRSRSKKAAATPETPAPQATSATTATPGNSGGTAAAPARVKSAATATVSTKTPNFHYTPDVQNRIRQRAYELFQQRGGQHGFDVEDWLRAEGEMVRS